MYVKYIFFYYAWKSQALDEKCKVLKNKGHFMFSRFFPYILRQTQTKILQSSVYIFYGRIIYDLSVQFRLFRLNGWSKTLQTSK